jgi:uncharacterized lipoprotein
MGLLSMLLAGCGDSMRGYLERETPTQTAAVRQDLTMPPDLRLPPPGSAPAAPETAAPATYDNSLDATAPVAQPPAARTANPLQDKYTRAGISLNKPDGSKKSDAELDAEYRAHYLAKKRQQNPNYGTVFNIGNIFKDE